MFREPQCKAGSLEHANGVPLTAIGMFDVHPQELAWMLTSTCGGRTSMPTLMASKSALWPFCLNLQIPKTQACGKGKGDRSPMPQFSGTAPSWVLQDMYCPATCPTCFLTSLCCHACVQAVATASSLLWLGSCAQCLFHSLCAHCPRGQVARGCHLCSRHNPG